MDLQMKPLTLDLSKLDGLSQKLIASHHENNYAGAVKRLGAIRKQLRELDWSSAPVFAINGLKREELVAANPAFLHELYFDALGAKAAAYVDAFMKNIRWDAVYRRYGAAVAGDAVPLGVGIAALDDDTQRVIDVRRAEDFAAAGDMVAGATWCDPTQVDQWSSEIDATKPVLVYCLKGLDIGRSTARVLRARGFDVRYLSGGIEAWKAAGKPLQPKGAAS